MRLLEQHGADIDAVTDCGRSVFMSAEENGHKDVLVYCIDESSLSTPEEKRVQSSNRASSHDNQVKNECEVNSSSEKFIA